MDVEKEGIEEEPVGMVGFHHLFQDVAERETRWMMTCDHPVLGTEQYVLVEAYCVEPHCDCRRLLINVMRGRDGRWMATIGYAFDEGSEMRGPYLDVMNPQSAVAKELLELVEEILKDRDYHARLERHYQMVKRAVRDPGHEIYEKLGSGVRRTREFGER